MLEDKNCVVVDADFFIKLTQYDDNNASLFRKLMGELDFQPVMHEYVACNEIKSFPNMRKLIEEGFIVVIKDSDYITEQNEQEYEDYFKDAFEQMNKYPFPEGENIHTYICKDENLGEIRSAYLAKKKHYPIFLSDDGTARSLVARLSTSKRKIEAWGIYDTLKKCKDKGGKIELKLLNPTISNIYRNQQDKLHELQRMYGES